MKRREFIQRTGLIAGAIAVAPSLLSAGKKGKKLVILHTNDTHSNIEPFPATHSKYPNQGGVSRRATLINQIRHENDNVLLLDAGDIFQGTPYFNEFKGELEMKVMEEMKYDVVTLGNHDFDIGMQAYASAHKNATFPVVNCNYDFGTTPLAALVKKSVIIKKAGYKIGILGVGIDLTGLVPASNFEGMVYTDPIATANKEAEFLKKQGCDLIICLSHLGYEFMDTTKVCDKHLAAKTKNIDIILGGHTHTFLTEPQTFTNAEGKNVIVNQVGYGGLFLGKIDVTFDSSDNSDFTYTAKPLDIV
jgi:5'-nucleotidase